MELFPSSDEDLWSLIKGVVDECDFYVLLIAHRYGSLTREGISYTEAEYEYARSAGKPVLAFFHAGPAPAATGEETAKQGRLTAFKELVSDTHTPGYWSDARELPFLVQQALEKTKRKHPAIGWTRFEPSR